MRIHCAVILVFIVFFASAAIVRASMDIESTNSATKGGLPEISRHSLIQGKRAAASKRVLKLRGAADMHTVDAIDEHEERGMLSNIVALASKASEKDSIIRRSYASGYVIRKSTRLSMVMVVYGLLGNLVVAGETTDTDLALLIPSIKEVADLKTFGEKLERSLYREWINKGTHPAEIKKRLDQNRVSLVNEHIAINYAMAYVRHQSNTLTGEALTKLGGLPPDQAVGILLNQKVQW